MSNKTFQQILEERTSNIEKKNKSFSDVLKDRGFEPVETQVELPYVYKSSNDNSAPDIISGAASRRSILPTQTMSSFPVVETKPVIPTIGPSQFDMSMLQGENNKQNQQVQQTQQEVDPINSNDTLMSEQSYLDSLPWYKKAASKLLDYGGMAKDSVVSALYGMGSTLTKPIDRLTNPDIWEPLNSQQILERDNKNIGDLLGKAPEYNPEYDPYINRAKNIGGIAGDLGGMAAGTLLTRNPIAGAGLWGGVNAYGNGGGAEDIAKGATSNALFMAVAGPISQLFEGAGASILKNTPDILKNSLIADVTNKLIAGGFGGAAGTIGSQQIYDPGSLPTMHDILTGSLMNAFFHGLPGTINSVNKSRVIKDNLSNGLNDFHNNINEMYKAAQSTSDINTKTDIYKGIVNEIDNSLNALSKNRYVGNNKEVQSLKEFLNFGKNNINDMLNRWGNVDSKVNLGTENANIPRYQSENVYKPNSQRLLSEGENILPQQETPLKTQNTEGDLINAARKFAIKQMEPGKTYNYKSDNIINQNNQPSQKQINVDGFYTPQISGSDKIANISSSGLPEGRFIALDKPFESDYHDSSKIKKANLSVTSVFDPDGLINSDTQQNHKAIYQEMVSEIAKQKPQNTRRFMADFLAKKGFDSYVRGIDGDKQNRELIVLNKDIPINYSDHSETKSSNKYAVGTNLKANNGANYQVTGINGDRYKIKNVDANFEIEVPKERLDSRYTVDNTNSEVKKSRIETKTPDTKEVYKQDNKNKETPTPTKSYDEYQNDIDSLEEELIRKYGEDEVVKAPRSGRVTYEGKETKLTNNELDALDKLYSLRDKVSENEDNSFVDGILNNVDFSQSGKEWIASKSDVEKVLKDMMDSNNLANIFGRDTNTSIDDIAKKLYNKLIQYTKAPSALWGEPEYALKLATGKVEDPFGKSLVPLFNQINQIMKVITGTSDNVYDIPNPKQIEAPNQETKEPNKVDILVDKITELVDTIKGNNDTNKEVARQIPTETIAQEQPENKQKKILDQPHDKIAESVLGYIKSGQSFSSDKLFDIADKAFGGTMAEGKYTVKDAYDSMELAVNQYILETGVKGSAIENIKKYQDMLSKLPTQTKRTVEMEQYQQFSTPPSIAYIAAWTANINNNDVMLEPSAGIGGIASFAKAFGAKTYVNELSDRRLNILESLPFDGFFNKNAEQIDNVLPDNIKPTVIVMNPPFSSAATRMGDKNSTSNAKRHIEQALSRLEPNGRLVAIVGRGMSDDATSFKSWWKDIKSEYNVRANIGIKGENYRKYGTNFDIQIFVIDKNGPTTNDTLTGFYENLNDIPKVLEAIRNDRQNRDNKQKAVVPNGESISNESRSNGVISTTSNGNSNEGTSTIKSTEQQTTITNDIGKPGTSKTREAIQSNDGAVRGTTDNTSIKTNADETRKTNDNSNTSGKQSNGDIVSGVVSENKSTEQIIENEDDVYSKYTPKKLSIKGAKPHITDLVESAAMAAVDPPDITYTPNLPKELIEKGTLSIAQLENIVYAGQAHEQKLSDGKRKGYFIGDGTGVGKGREISGIILDNFRQGRNKAVWISNNPKLMQDAKRDWSNLGENIEDIKDLRKYKADSKVSENKGIVFTSYSTLKSGAKNNPTATRLNQIVDWLGKDFDGVIVFDEAHNMGNAVEFGQGLNKTKASKQALTGVDLQDKLPNARIVYASATGATNVHNLAYLTRLGLWGEGTSFRNVNDFITKISSGGIAAMELVARDMKSLGVYMARNLSFKGVEYDTLTHDLSPMQEEIYDTMSRAWQKVLSNIEAALETTGAKNNGMAKGQAKSAFYGAMQRFYNQIITSMSMPSVVADIKKELEKGNSAVIQLVNTNQAATDRQIVNAEEEGIDLEDLDLTPTDTLIQFLQKSFPTFEYEEYLDDKGNKRSRVSIDETTGKPIVSRSAVKIRDSLIEEIKYMKVPDGPLEILFDTFGVENVAEVTGRNRRVVPKKDDKTGQMKRTLESRTEKHALSDAQNFQDGKKQILVFSDAGGTGQSYHADRTAKNQNKRIHYLLQPGWNAFKATQGFGRTHRSGQVQAPTFRLITTNIMGQKRFTSTIARRLDQLGALTKGQRQAGSGMFGQKDNLESDLAKDSLQMFFRSLGRDRIEGLDGMDIIKKMGLKEKLTDDYGNYKEDINVVRDINTFLNRILSLEVKEQNKVFESFFSMYEESFNNAIENGLIDMGLENYMAEKVVMKDEKIIRKDSSSGAESKYIQMVAYKKPNILSFEAVQDYKATPFEGFVRINSSGEVRAMYKARKKTLPNGNIVATYDLVSPMLGIQSNYQQSTIDEKTTAISKKEWKKAWNEQITKLPEYTEETLHMLSGTLLPIWDKLPTSNTRVVRVITDEGKQYLGRIIPGDEIDSVLRRFDIDRTKEVYSPESIYKKIIENGEFAQLEKEKIRLTRRRVSGENRIEITGNNLWFYGKMQGVITETVNYQRRYFIPVGESGYPIIERIIKDNPIVTMGKGSMQSESDTDGLTSRNGGPVLGTATGQNTTGKSKKASEIYKDFSKNLGVAVRQGRVGVGRLGEFNNRNHLIKIRDANDIPTLSHETGHYLDNLYNLSTNRSHFRELEQLGQTTSMSSYSKARIRREGVAEFVRLYLTENDTARNRAPGFYNFFEQTLPDEVINTLKELRKEIWALVNLDPVSRVGKSISFSDDETPLDKLKSIKDVDIIAGVRRLYTGIVDATYPLEWAAGKAGKEQKEEIIDRLSQLRGYEGIALYDLNPHINNGFHQVDLNGKKVGLSYGAITKYIHDSKAKRKDFMKYQVARRSQDYSDRGLKMPDTKATYDETIKVLETKYPDFIETFDRLTKYRYNNSKLLADSGIYSNEQLDEMYMSNRNYVPLKRIMDAFDFVAGSGGKLGSAKKLIKGVAGSGRDIMDPEESDINNTFLYRSAAMRNVILQNLTNMFDHEVNPNAKEGMGWLISRAPTRVQPVEFNLSQVEKYLKDLGVDTSGLDLDIMARVFMPNYLAKENQIVVYRNGRPVIYDVHPELYNAISGMRFEQLEWITKPLVAIASLQRAGIIYTEKYLMNNLFRDVGHSLISSKSGIKPWSIIGGLYHTMLNTTTYKDAMKYGATTNYSAVNERDYAQETIQDIQNSSKRYKKIISKLPPWRWLRIIRDTIEPLEMAARVAEYKRYLKQVGESEENIRKAVHAARDLSVDFRRMGSWIKALQLNRLSLFLNSQIQGGDKFVRTFKDHPFRTTIRGFLYLTLPTLALLAAVSDDEDYKNLPQWRKDLFWNIPLGGGVFFPIPIPYEFGLVFKILPERLVNQTILHDPKAWRDFAETFKTTFIPKPSISALQPEFDIWFNKDWKGNPVESRSDLEVSPELRYNSYTSEFAKSIGQATGQSPKQIEHLITGHLGTWGKTGLDMYDSAVSTDTSAKEYGGGYFKKFVIDASQSPQSVEDFYKNYADIRTMNADARRIGGKPNALEKALNSEFMSAAEEINKIRDLQAIVDKKNLSNEKLIDAALQKAMIEKTKKMNNLYDAAKKITKK